MVDLNSSDESRVEIPSNNARVLESGDNPISSISSKGGLMSFKAFKDTDAQNQNKNKELIVIPTNDITLNTNLADSMKINKQNFINKLSKREKCKSKNRVEKKPKTKEELYEIRK